MPVILGTIRNGAPYVAGLVMLPHLGISGIVEFLVDTGASRTCLHPRDARALGIGLSGLSYTRDSQGIGGRASYSPHNAYILFFPNDKPVTQQEKLELLIAEPTDVNLGLPSLLGRDVINRWATLYAPRNGVLRFDAV